MLGFIVEGDTEKMILESPDFKNFLNTLHIEYIPDVVNVKGNGNLLPHRITEHTQILLDKGATQIIILTDLDDDKCITETKNRIKPLANQIIIISGKQIEAWFLAHTDAIRQFLRTGVYTCENPETYSDPFEEISQLRLQYCNRGIQDKLPLARLMVNKNSFSVLQAARHPNCNSAKYFIEKIKGIAAMI
ncbi:MAG: hypothetical protein ABI855_09400 [Bacteroidota bacterium]